MSLATSLAVKPLSPALGAEIVGVDLARICRRRPSPTFSMPGISISSFCSGTSHLSEDEQIRFAEHFGVLQKRGRPPEAATKRRRSSIPS